MLRCYTRLLSAGAVLALAGSALGQTFFGLPHTPQGQLQLAEDPVGRLVISNIGSSGKDGVSIALGEGSDGWCGEVDLGQAGTVVHWSLEVRVNRWESAFGPAVPSFGLDLTSEDGATGRVELSVVEDNMNPACVRMELLLDGQVVHSRDLVDGAPPVLVGNIGSSGQDGVRIDLRNDPVLPRCIATARFPDRITVEDPLQQIVLCDAVRYTLDDVSLSGSGTGNLYEEVTIKPIRLELAVAGDEPPGNDSITVNAECILAHEMGHNFQGVSHLGGDDGDLIVSNIGSSGLDGVRTSLPGGGGGSGGAVYIFRTPIGLGDGQGLCLGGSMTLDTLPPGPPVERTIEFPPGPAQQRTLHTNLGSFVIYEVRLNGAVQFQGGAPDGDICTIRDGGGLTVKVSDFGMSRNGLILGPTLSVRFDGDVLVTPNGQAPVLGDEIRVMPENAAIPVTELLELKLTGTNLSPVEIGGIQVNPVNDPPTVYLGQKCTPVGQSVFEQSPTGALRVSNLGSSGCDGVSVDLGETEGHEMELDVSVGGPWPEDTAVHFDATMSGTGATRTLSCVQRASGDVDVSLTPSDGVQSVVVELLIENQVVASQSFSLPLPDPLITVGDGSGSPFVSTILQSDSLTRIPVGADHVVMHDTMRVELDDQPIGHAIAGGASVDVDKFHVRQEFGPVQRSVNPLYKKKDMRGTNPLFEGVAGGGMTRIDVPSMAIRQFGLAQQGLGAVELSGGTCGDQRRLKVSNLGSSGKDGVSIADGFGDDDGPDDLCTVGVCLPRGIVQDDGDMDELIWTQLGHVDDADIDIGSARMTRNGGNEARGVGPVRWMAPESLQIRVFNQGIEQGTVSGLPPTEQVVSSVVPQTAGTYAFELVVAPGSMAPHAPTGVRHTFAWDAPRTLTLPGLPPVVGDELEFLITPQGGTSGPAPQVTFLSTEVTATSAVGDATIVLESVETLHAPCFGDTNGDNVVNVDDLVNVIVEWGTSGPAADVNVDGIVDVNDLVGVITAWGDCP